MANGNVTLELYNPDAAQGGAGVGAGVYASPAAAFGGLERIMLTQKPAPALQAPYQTEYTAWHQALTKQILSTTSTRAHV